MGLYLNSKKIPCFASFLIADTDQKIGAKVVRRGDFYRPPTKSLKEQLDISLARFAYLPGMRLNHDINRGHYLFSNARTTFAVPSSTRITPPHDFR